MAESDPPYASSAEQGRFLHLSVSAHRLKGIAVNGIRKDDPLALKAVDQIDLIGPIRKIRQKDLTVSRISDRKIILFPAADVDQLHRLSIDLILFAIIGIHVKRQRLPIKQIILQFDGLRGLLLQITHLGVGELTGVEFPLHLTVIHPPEYQRGDPHGDTDENDPHLPCQMKTPFFRYIRHADPPLLSGWMPPVKPRAAIA